MRDQITGSALGLAATRTVNSLNLTRETPSGSTDRVMYRASDLRCNFHQTNTSQRGQDVVATPCTTTVIYTLRAQAETDVDDFKNGHLLGED